MWSDICLLWESRARPAGTLLKCTKCLLLHLLTFVFFVLLVTRPSHRQAARVVLCVCVCERLRLLVCVCAPLLQHTHLHFIHVGRNFFLPSELLSPCFADKQKQGGAVSWGFVQGLGGGVGLCCRFMWHRQNITRCRCNHAVCFALRYCSNKGCDGKTRKCLSPSPLKFSLLTFSNNNLSLQPVSEPSESKTVHTQKHSSGTRACEERSTNNRHEAKKKKKPSNDF